MVDVTFSLTSTGLCPVRDADAGTQVEPADEAKLGIAVVLMLVAPIKSHPTLTIRKLVRPSVNRTIFLLKRRDRSLFPATSAAWSALVELFRRHKH